MSKAPKIDFDDVVHIEETDITVRGYRRRTTVPSRIFQFLKLKEGDTLRWIAFKDGKVLLTKVEEKKASK